MVLTSIKKFAATVLKLDSNPCETVLTDEEFVELREMVSEYCETSRITVDQLTELLTRNMTLEDSGPRSKYVVPF